MFESEVLRSLKFRNNHHITKRKGKFKKLLHFVNSYRLYTPFHINIFLIIVCALSGSVAGIITFQIIGVLMAIYYRIKIRKCDRMRNFKQT